MLRFSLLRFLSMLFLACFFLNYSTSSYAAGPFDIYWYEKPAYESPSGNFQFYYGGYWQADLLAFANAPQLQPGFHWRSGRTAIGMAFLKAWKVDVSYDFAEGLLFDAFISYDGAKNFTLIAGQFDPVFGLANTTNTPNINFLELPLPVIVYSPAYSPGIEFGIYKKPVSIYGSVFGPPLGSTVHGKAPIGEILSIAYVPLDLPKHLLYFSLSGWNQGTDGDHTVDFSVFPELLPKNDGMLIDTGNIIDVNYFRTLDAAVAWARGSFEIQGEYIKTWVNREQNRPTLQFQGYYVAASYFLTGEARKYNFESAGFVGITPIHSKYGAWEIALRYSRLSLQNQDILGGREDNIAAELSWYPIQSVKLILNYIRAEAKPNSDGIHQNANLYGLRLQFVF